MDHKFDQYANKCPFSHCLLQSHLAPLVTNFFQWKFTSCLSFKWENVLIPYNSFLNYKSLHKSKQKLHIRVAFCIILE